MSNYDAWKTRSPDDEHRGEVEFYDDDEREECRHWAVNVAYVTGNMTCQSCGESLGYSPIVDRWFWVRRDFRWQRHKFRVWRIGIRTAVVHWWRGHRSAPWRPDDEVPF